MVCRGGRSRSRRRPDPQIQPSRCSPTLPASRADRCPLSRVRRDRVAERTPSGEDRGRVSSQPAGCLDNAPRCRERDRRDRGTPVGGAIAPATAAIELLHLGRRPRHRSRQLALSLLHDPLILPISCSLRRRRVHVDPEVSPNFCWQTIRRLHLRPRGAPRCGAIPRGMRSGRIPGSPRMGRGSPIARSGRQDDHVPVGPRRGSETKGPGGG
jgi:hypothetical protein